MKSRIVQPAASFQPPETCAEHEGCQAAQTPLEDLRKNALEHYETVSASAHQWYSVIPKAINAYFDSQTSPATSPVAPTVDTERLNRLLDALPEIPSEEEAEAVLQAAGTSGKEVVNGFIEKLLRENLELKTKLEPLPHLQQLIDQVRRVADIGSAEEFNDALERLKTIRAVVDAELPAATPTSTEDSK